MSNATPASGNGESILRGFAGAPGLAHGPVVLWKAGAPTFARLEGCKPRLERGRLQAARDQARTYLKALRARAETSSGAKDARIFEAHVLILDDPALLEKADAALSTGRNAEAAWMDAVQHFASLLRNLPDPTLSARAADVLDVGEGVLRIMMGMGYQSAPELTDPSVIVAADLTPSQTASLDRTQVLAFCCAEGGPTSHTVILARALELPAVVGLGPSILRLPEGTPVLVDGSLGCVTAWPTNTSLRAFEESRAHMLREAGEAKASAGIPAMTRDGRSVQVAANIANAEDARRAVDAGADAVGLFRTEFLFLGRNEPPGEEEQVGAYREIFEILGNRPIVVRTLDAGGDKPMGYLDFGRELNPFLGWRGIRVAHEHPQLLKTQLRALLRAGSGKNLHIMLPMVSNHDEVQAGRDMLNAIRVELQAAGQSPTSQLEFGIMVEVPATAVRASHFAGLVDFFSIGTNDLTQYTLAADRTNARVAGLASAFDPAVLHLIARTIEAAHEQGRWVGLCGEFASDPSAIPLLLGLGLDEFSMAPASIPQAKSRLRALSAADCAPLAREALLCPTAESVRQLVQKEAPP